MSSRTLPLRPSPPDQTRPLAPPAPARRLPPSGDQAAAYLAPAATRQRRHQTTPSRAHAKTGLPEDGPTMLAPMGLRRDDDRGVAYRALSRPRSGEGPFALLPPSVAAAHTPRMIGRDIIVIGASAGGVQALIRIVRDLPRELNAAVFIVVHIGA